MSRGDLAAALLWHPLGPVAFAATGLVAAALLLGAAGSRVWRVRSGERETRLATAALAAGLLVFGALRWIGGF